MAKRKTPYGKYARTAWNIATTTANAYKRYKSYTGTKNKRKTYVRQGVTGHHDSTNIYRRKRMPRRRRRMWQKFSKKVNYIINKQIAPSSLIRTVVIARDAPARNQQLLAVASLYSGYGSNADLSDDQITLLKDCAARAYGDSTKYYQAQVKVTSAVLDVTVENRSDDDLAIPSMCDCEVDVYELQCLRDVMVQDATQNNRDIYDFIINCCNEQPRPVVTDLTGGANIGSVLDSTTVGWTPFANSRFCKYFRVLKKTKKYMTPGGYFTYQIRAPADKIVKGNAIDTPFDGGGTSTVVFPLFTKNTRVLLFIAKGEPLTSGTSYWGKPRLTIGMTKSFNYRVVDKAMATGYVN